MAVIINPDNQRWLALLQRASLPEATRVALTAGALRRIEVREDSREVLLHVELPSRLPLAEREVAAAALAAGLDAGESRLQLVVLVPGPDPAALPELMALAWPDVVVQAKARLPRTNGMLDAAVWRLERERLVVELATDVFREALEKADAGPTLAALVARETGWHPVIELRAPAPAARPKAKKAAALPAAVQFDAEEPLPPPPDDATAPAPEDDPAQQYIDQWMQRQGPAVKGGPKRAAPGQVLLGKAIPDGAPVREIRSIIEEENKLIIEGEVVGVETRDLRSGRILVAFSVCDLLRGDNPNDLGDTLPCKAFREGRAEPWEQNLQPGAWVRVRGNAQTDRFSQELTLMAEDIVLGQRPERLDEWEGDRRIELHLHTRYSGMDAMIDPEALLTRLQKWGHTAVAVTDHGVVQAFPFLDHARSKPKGFKLIYGCELNMVDDGVPIVTRPRPGESLDTVEFVVLDIETTGFSPIGDDIIELGAVRYCGGSVGAAFQSFVRPAKVIPDKVVELTGITARMVADAPLPAEALRRFFDFVGDAVIVAHNAGFDYSFLRYHREKVLGEPLHNPVLDTLILGRSLLPRLKSHSLSALTEHLGVQLVDHHRADADARTTAHLLDKLLGLAREQKPDLAMVEELNHLTAGMNVEQLHPHHCTVLVRSQPGMKALYKLISLSHLSYFFRTPRVPRTELAQAREYLLLGSGGDGGALYEALIRGVPDSDLAELAEFYDYIEILPRSALAHLLAEGQVSSVEQLLGLNRRLYELGKRLGKPVVAVGDAHFLDPHQQIFRRILKGGIGFRGEHDAALYLRTTGEMLDEFAYLGEDAAREVVITATHALAAMIDAGIKPVPDKLFTPVLEGAEEQTREMAYARARQYYGEPLPELVAARLEKELGSIIGNGFAVIYYIAHLLVKKSNELGYLVGSRGSVGSSFVAWCMGITEVNALPPHYLCPQCHHVQWFNDGSVGSGFDLPAAACPRCQNPRLYKDGQDIPFETFLGFQGDKVPDIDLNFSGVVQGRIQKYSEELLGGEKQVFKAGTIGTIAEKTAYGMVKGWLEENNIAGVREAHVGYLRQGLVDVKRTTGQHPGGMVVVPVGMEVEEVTPVQFPADDRDSGVRTTHFDFHSYEGVLLKLDILGHDDPTTLRMLQDLTGLDVTTIPMDDPLVLRLFSPGGSEALGLRPGDVEYDLGTIAVPEFGTGFVRRMLLETRPQSFSDLVRISGLSHGTDVWAGVAQELIKQGKCTLQTVIPTRDDIMVRLIYWGVDPPMAFKIMESVRKGRGVTPEMEQAMTGHNVPDWYIWSCKGIKYLFPKAHAVAYVLSSLRVAYFKVHYPREYYATYFSVRAGSFDAELVCKGPEAVRRFMDEIAAKGRDATAKEKDALMEMELVMEAFRRNIQFRRVDLLRSEAMRFTIDPDGALLCPFAALSGVGENAARAVVEARTQGPFQSVEDLRVRARLNKTVIELLHTHGCLQGMPENNQLVFNL